MSKNEHYFGIELSSFIHQVYLRGFDLEAKLRAQSGPSEGGAYQFTAQASIP